MRDVFFDALSKMGRAANKETLNEFIKTTNELYEKYINKIKSKQISRED